MCGGGQDKAPPRGRAHHDRATADGSEGKATGGWAQLATVARAIPAESTAMAGGRRARTGKPPAPPTKAAGKGGRPAGTLKGVGTARLRQRVRMARGHI